MKTKTIGGRYTWDEARELEGDGWRLPTIFELITLQQEYEHGDDKYFWSASTYVGNPADAWNVLFYNGLDYAYYKIRYYYVRLVLGGKSFDHLTPVSREEVQAFKKDGTLPKWHPPINFKEMKRMIELTRAEALMILRHLSSIEGFLWTKERSSDVLEITDESIKLLTEKLEVEDGSK